MVVCKLIEKLFIFIILIVGVLAFFMISSTGSDHYLKTAGDPLNNSGIQDTNSSAYSLVNGTNTALGDNAPIGIWLIFLFAVIFLVFLIFFGLKH